MSVRSGILALLADQSGHGYGLKSRFDASTAGAWPLNVGQVYTTLTRLERDGLVRADESNDTARQAWAITTAGRDEVAAWFRTAVADQPLRDELALKLLLAMSGRSADVQQLLQTQRAAAMTRLQEYTRQKRTQGALSPLQLVLLLDALILKAEAELKWLDLCEDRLQQRASTQGRGVQS